jgi:cytochrome c
MPSREETVDCPGTVRWKSAVLKAGAFVIAAMLILLDQSAVAAGNAKRGAQVFQQCIACHSIELGEHMTGPSLAHVWNRKAGSAEDFLRYSDAMKRAGIVWNDATLDKWLANPEKFLPGTAMTFPGLKESQARQDVIAYLKAVSEGKAPEVQQGGRGMMGMRRDKLDLRKAPPEGQVTAIRHCGDTYTVDTADGKSQKIWEFNLRFKTDTSKLGPAPGKPVVVGAGMQGDRASIVFASPKEISESIKQACP